MKDIMGKIRPSVLMNKWTPAKLMGLGDLKLLDLKLEIQLPDVMKFGKAQRSVESGVHFDIFHVNMYDKRTGQELCREKRELLGSISHALEIKRKMRQSRAIVKSGRLLFIL